MQRIRTAIDYLIDAFFVLMGLLCAYAKARHLPPPSVGATQQWLWIGVAVIAAVSVGFKIATWRLQRRMDAMTERQ